MINSINPTSQVVNANANVLFTVDRVRTNSCRGCQGWLAHDLGSGLFTLTKAGMYFVSYNLNATSDATGVASTTVDVNGEELQGTQSVYTIATANAVGNLSAGALIQVPCGGSYTISVNNNSALDLTVTNPNIVIWRLA